MPLTKADVLNKAAEIIEAQSRLGKLSSHGHPATLSNSCCCTWTVIGRGTSTVWKGDLTEDFEPLIVSAIRELYPDFEITSCYPIFAWNDVPSRTKEESAAVLRKAAELAASCAADER